MRWRCWDEASLREDGSRVFPVQYKFDLFRVQHFRDWEIIADERVN